MARPNPHGEAALEPSAYSFEFWFDNQPWRDLPGWEHPDVIQAVRKMRQRVEEKRDLLRDRSTSVYKPHGRCAHCGNWIRYHVVLRDRRDDALIAVGQDCADNRFGRSDDEWAEYKDRLDRMRAEAARGEKRMAIREQFPEAADLLETCLEEREEEIENGHGRGLGWSQEFEDRWPDFVVDVATRSYRHGRLSEAQAEAVVDAVPEHRDRRARWREEAESRPPVPEGRVDVEGEVLKVEMRENGYGGRVVMTVRSDDGWTVWGTAPKAFRWDVEKGDRVRFRAEIEASDDDESFGFYSRPTKAELIDENQ